jgi:hypothetical protein
MNIKRVVVATLDSACQAVDALAYRPAVVKLTLSLRRWWKCDLARLSIWLDDRWALGYWKYGAPDSLCDSCRRRAAWLVLGGYNEEWDDEPPEPDDFLRNHPVHLCGWCKLSDEIEIDNEASLDAALADARGRGIAWQWRWR